jgi:hypothetical protein
VILEKYVISKIEIKSLILILMILIAILNFKNDKHCHYNYKTFSDCFDFKI